MTDQERRQEATVLQSTSLPMDYVHLPGVTANILSKQCSSASFVQAYWRFGKWKKKKQMRDNDFWTDMSAYDDLARAFHDSEEIQVFASRWRLHVSEIPYRLLHPEVQCCSRHWFRDYTIFEELSHVSPDGIHSLVELSPKGDMSSSNSKLKLTVAELLLYFRESVGEM